MGISELRIRTNVFYVHILLAHCFCSALSNVDFVVVLFVIVADLFGLLGRLGQDGHVVASGNFLYRFILLYYFFE